MRLKCCNNISWKYRNISICVFTNYFVLIFFRPDPGRRKKKKFYFLTSLGYIKRFYECLKGLHKAFWGVIKKCKKKIKIIFVLVQLSETHWAKKVKVHHIFGNRKYLVAEPNLFRPSWGVLTGREELGPRFVHITLRCL